MEQTPQRPVVIFYDRCVSKTHILHAIIPEFPDALHFYIGGLFSETIQRNDRKIFEAVEELRRSKYSKYICFLVTCDNHDFQTAVESHPAYGNTLHLIVGENVSNVSYENGLRKMKEIAGKIRMKLIEISDKP